jgi:hypothetical protein
LLEQFFFHLNALDFVLPSNNSQSTRQTHIWSHSIVGFHSIINSMQQDLQIWHSGFLEVVAKTWNKPTHKSSIAANLNEKFKRLRYDLMKWSKSISNLSRCIDKALLQLD